MVGKNYLYHESNIDGKCRDVKANKYRHIFQQFIKFKREKYAPYKAAQLRITGLSHADVDEKVALLNQYYPSVNEFITTHRITFQSKFRPTILEEFCGFLLKDLPEIENLRLDFFNKDVFAGISLDREGNAQIRTKNIDFCIGKNFIVKIEGNEHKIIIPIIAVECKTYLDKTMFSEAQFTAQKMKQGSPNVRVYVIAEANQVDKDEIPTKGRTPIDQIYIIRGDSNLPINSDSVFEFFSDIKLELEHLTEELEIHDIGRILID